MTLSLQNLRDSIIQSTATDLSDWTNGNVDLDLLINKSWWDIMDQFDFREKEATPIVFPTVAGQIIYDVGTITNPVIFDALQRLAIEDPISFEHSDLDLLTDFTYEDELINTSGEQARPTNYFRRGSKIYLFPTPDQVYNISIYFLQVLSDLTTTPPIPESWHEIIEYGANWRALLAKREYTQANELRKHQIYLINGRTPVKVKELADTKRAGVEVLGRDY